MMSTEIILTIITASLASGGIAGYVAERLIERTIDHKFKLYEAKQNIIWQNEIAYRKAQLEELYGPIYSMLKTSEKIYKIWKEDKKIDEVNLNVKKYFESNNNEIRRLLVDKMHLIDGDEIPSHFVDFMTSAMIWNWYCAKDYNAKFPDKVEKLPEVKWPREKFQEYIYNKTKELKKELNKLYEKNRME